MKLTDEQVELLSILAEHAERCSEPLLFTKTHTGSGLICGGNHDSNISLRSSIEGTDFQELEAEGFARVNFSSGGTLRVKLTKRGIDAAKKGGFPMREHERPAAVLAPEAYRLHSEIEKVSGALLRDGHFKSAAFEAYVRVIEEVKSRAANPTDREGRGLDGDKLMHRAFGCENQTPLVQFNSLGSQAERDEQMGFLYLFKGIVGLRNAKGHSNRLFDDPSRAFEYLALASVLMRMLEIAPVQAIARRSAKSDTVN
ncbi:MAG: TIGR02391 family protein [Bryobacteraceae bacterium]|nr:TIGR02391 family protein [Bryobacteraceae bacterium]